MQPLVTQFAKGNYRYRQVWRQGDIAIFEQQHKENPQVIRYEVVKIRVVPPTTTPGGTTLPEREAYPSSSSWGLYGFTTYTLAEAQALAATRFGPGEVGEEKNGGEEKTAG